MTLLKTYRLGLFFLFVGLTLQCNDGPQPEPDNAPAQPKPSLQITSRATSDSRPIVPPGRPLTEKAARHDTSAPLSIMARKAPKWQTGLVPVKPRLSRPFRQPTVHISDPVVQRTLLASTPMPGLDLSFEGISNINYVLPPDTNGDVGPHHYIQWVNLSLAIWDKNGNLLLGPVAGNTIWTGFGGPCEVQNSGDPIALYDHLADRWMISQFAVSGRPYYQCIAVSTGPDPTGSWHRYAFKYSDTQMNDYPKFGVWPDGYYMTVNQFYLASSYSGVGVVVYERSQMLKGDPARQIIFDLGAVSRLYGHILPADLDGPPPVEGSPHYLAGAIWDRTEQPLPIMGIWEFKADWTNPDNSTCGLNGSPNVQLAIEPYDIVCSGSRSCIPQKDTTVKLDALSDLLMYRLQYRNFGSYETLVFNHTVDAGEALSSHSGIRWYEFRKNSSGWWVHQQSTFAPDEYHRWTASIAMDGSGNIAMGYSVSSSLLFPSIYYTGRLADDLPLSEMTRFDGTMMVGTGSQTHPASRWGDYSMMGVDPVDDCTFWYTNEYYSQTGLSSWKTRIGAFKFPSCVPRDLGGIYGHVTDNNGGSFIPSARVQIGGYSAVTNGSGFYQIPYVGIGSYNGWADQAGYQRQAIAGVAVNKNSWTRQDFSLVAKGVTTLSGTVSDGNGHLWPLCARIDIFGGALGKSVYTNCHTGNYQTTVFTDETYWISVTAAGYQTATTALAVAEDPRITDFQLIPDGVSCTAIGYQNASAWTMLYQEEFEVSDGAFSATGNNSSWEWGVPGSGPGSAYNSSKLWATNLNGNYNAYEQSFLTSPSINLSNGSNSLITVSFWDWFVTSKKADFIGFEVSKDNGATWQIMYGPYTGNSSEWIERSIGLDPSYAVPDFRLRFWLYANGSVQAAGYYLDDITIYGRTCVKEAGGLVIGQVSYSGNGVNHVTISDSNGHHTTSFQAHNGTTYIDGFYQLFLPEGLQTITVQGGLGYHSDSHEITVVADDLVTQNFELKAANLSIDPLSISLSLKENGTTYQGSLIFSNTGQIPGNFSLFLINSRYVAPEPRGPFAVKVRHLGPKRLNDPDIPAGAYYLDPLPADPIEGGEVLSSFITTGITTPWGISTDLAQGTLWVGKYDLSQGHNDQEFTTSGELTGRSIPFDGWGAVWPADMTYNPFTRKLWQIQVGSGNCIYELDSETQALTGQTICPDFGTPQRGLAYDPVSDTFYAGSWDDSTIYHFDATGTILDSKDVGLAISGLAYHFNGNLFTLVRWGDYDVYLLDTHNAYEVKGGFWISEMQENSAAGMEIDCNGHLWVVSKNEQTVFEVDSGKTGSCSYLNLPWMTLLASSGTVAALGQTEIGFQVNPVGLSPGGYEGFVRVITDTPTHTMIAPVQLTVEARHYPVAEAGGDQIVSKGSLVFLNGSGSYDSSGSIVAYNWSQVSGTTVTLHDASSAMASFTAPARLGTLVFRLTVQNDDAALASDEVQITVVPADYQPPVANAGENQSVSANTLVTLDGSQSYAVGGAITEYGWIQTGGTHVSIANARSVSPTFAAPNADEVLTFELRVTDNNSLSASDPVDITVISVEMNPPTAYAGEDMTVKTGKTVYLNGSDSQPGDSPIASYNWTKLWGPEIELQMANSAVPYFTAPSGLAIIELLLTVTDQAGLSASDPISVTVVETLPPVADVGNHQTVSSGQTVYLDGSGSTDPDGVIVQYQWSQASGVSVVLSEDNTAQASFNAPPEAGKLTFELVVTDNDGLTGTSRVVIRVEAEEGGGGCQTVGNVNQPVSGLLLLLLVSLLWVSRIGGRWSEYYPLVGKTRPPGVGDFS